MNIQQYLTEICSNRLAYAKRLILRKVYAHFYSLIAKEVDLNISGYKIDIGSGMGKIKARLPDCLAPIFFPNPWPDHVENAYLLSFNDYSIRHLILINVWHHLEHPVNALNEFRRVLAPEGRLLS